MGIDTGAADHIPDPRTEERPKKITMVARDNMLTIDLAQRNPELWDLFTGKEEYNPEVVDRF